MIQRKQQDQSFCCFLYSDGVIPNCFLNAEEFHVDKDKIMLCGFSAGAHTCGSVAVHWQEFEESETGEYASVSAKPNAVILSYPVITSGDCAHRGSFTALLGADASEEELVPVQKSFLFAQALQEKKIPYAFHVFSKGKHGLSLADEWIRTTP